MTTVGGGAGRRVRQAGLYNMRILAAVLPGQERPLLDSLAQGFCSGILLSSFPVYPKCQCDLFLGLGVQTKRQKNICRLLLQWPLLSKTAGEDALLCCPPTPAEPFIFLQSRIQARAATRRQGCGQKDGWRRETRGSLRDFLPFLLLLCTNQQPRSTL